MAMLMILSQTPPVHLQIIHDTPNCPSTLVENHCDRIIICMMCIKLYLYIFHNLFLFENISAQKTNHQQGNEVYVTQLCGKITAVMVHSLLLPYINIVLTNQINWHFCLKFSDIGSLLRCFCLPSLTLVPFLSFKNINWDFFYSQQSLFFPSFVFIVQLVAQLH